MEAWIAFLPLFQATRTTGPYRCLETTWRRRPCLSRRWASLCSVPSTGCCHRWANCTGCAPRRRWIRPTSSSPATCRTQSHTEISQVKIMVIIKQTKSFSSNLFGKSKVWMFQLANKVALQMRYEVIQMSVWPCWHWWLSRFWGIL